MKNLHYLLSILFLVTCLLIFSACEEVGPNINFTEPEAALVDSTYFTDAVLPSQSKHILMEEFTGVRCPNCPDGAILADQLAALNPGKIAIVSIHSGFFSVPYTDEQNLKTEQGEAIEALLGIAPGYPAASINRKIFDGEDKEIVTSPNWSNYIDEELANPPLANVIVETEYNDMDGELIVRTNTHFLEDINETVKLSIVLLENNIIQTQDVNGEIVADYNHKHVLRTMLSPFDGIILGATVQQKETFQKDFSFSDFGDEWKRENMIVVVFAHKSGGDKSVLQVAEADVF